MNEYKIVSGTANEVECFVNDFILEGWQPIGSLQVIHVVEGCYIKCFQAMVRK